MAESIGTAGDRAEHPLEGDVTERVHADPLRDLRHAARGLASRPTYTIVVIATLALVTAAASAVLAVVSATFVRPLPFPDGNRLVQMFLMPPGESAWMERNP